MMKKFLFMSIVLGLSACVVNAPSVSSSVVETDSNGTLMNIHAQHCGFHCTNMAMQKAQEVCPKGFSVKNTQNGLHHTEASMIIRCEK